MSDLTIFTTSLKAMTNLTLMKQGKDLVVDVPFLEHMTIVGLLDVEASPSMQVSLVMSQIDRAIRLGVWEMIA